jgi:CheY-like chemotaxis protein
MGRRILIIDDDVDFVESEKLLLENNGYEVITAFDGQEGYRKALEENPDLILLDVVMTTEDEGFRIAHRLKKNAAHARIPIIILSSVRRSGGIIDGDGLPEGGAGESAAPAGGKYPSGGEKYPPVEGYIEKPVDPDALLGTLHRMLD